MAGTPAPETHLAGAKAHAAASAQLRTLLPGWAITAQFYSAVHLVRAYLSARHGHHVVSHDEMHALWNRYPELRKAKPEYVFLKQISEQHRYYLEDFKPEDVDSTQPKLEKVRKVFEPLIERALSARPAKLP